MSDSRKSGYVNELMVAAMFEPGQISESEERDAVANLDGYKANGQDMSAGAMPDGRLPRSARRNHRVGHVRRRIRLSLMIRAGIITDATDG